MNITLRGMPLDEELIYFARKCAEQLRRPCSVVIEKREGQRRPDVEVRIAFPAVVGRPFEVSARDPHPFLALQQAVELAAISIGSVTTGVSAPWRYCRRKDRPRAIAASA